MIQQRTCLFIVIQQQMMSFVQYQLMIWTMQGNQKEQIMIGMWIVAVLCSLYLLVK